MKPIIFSERMINAILDGIKTQTRRIAKEKHNGKCPYGKPGDTLYVKETWQARHDLGGYWHEYKPSDRNIFPHSDWKAFYRADIHEPGFVPRWISPIFMPKWASRIHLTIDSVRCERLHDISVNDIKAEGIMPCNYGHRIYDDYAYYNSFNTAWDNINAKRGYSFESNPLVWVVGFRLEGIVR